MSDRSLLGIPFAHAAPAGPRLAARSTATTATRPPSAQEVLPGTFESDVDDVALHDDSP